MIIKAICILLFDHYSFLPFSSCFVPFAFKIVFLVFKLIIKETSFILLIITQYLESKFF
jgi:hypothetical protein